MLLRNLLRGAALMSVSSLPLFCATKKKNQVYMWGNGVYQARPDALLQFKNFCPKKITNLPDDLIKLEFGEYYQAGIDEKGGLWIWKTQTMDANKDTINGQSDHERQGVQQIAKDVAEVKFTTGYIWVLSTKGRVFQFPIVKEIEEGEVKGTKIGKMRQVEPLRGATQIATGADHMIALRKGQVWSMGDDTYGQCGVEVGERQTFPPFNERRISYPTKIPNLRSIKKISAGSSHCLALDESGSLFGWGSNSNMQLSHEQQFSRMNSPMIAIFTPVKISKNLDNSEIIDMKGGEFFSVIVAKNRLTDSYEVLSFGNNIKGELGLGQIRHVRDITKIEALSDFILKRKGKEEKVLATSLGCGNSHAIVLLNIGYIMEWGDNQHGQMGNRKRSPIYSPIIVREFSQKKILGVFAGLNSSGVIIKAEVEQKK